jgi:hypothetical protein
VTIDVPKPAASDGIGCKHGGTGQHSIPAAKFRHSVKLDSATNAALNFPPSALQTQHRCPSASKHRLRTNLSLRSAWPAANYSLYLEAAPRIEHRQ